MESHEPMVLAEWLHANLRNPNIRVLDASWYLPTENRNALEEYQVAHIPGAIFFGIDQICDPMSNLPHMLPSEDAFAAAVSALGIGNKDYVIVYDGKGLYSAARVWWMFQVFGHNKVWVLDGGLPQWYRAGYEVESTMPKHGISAVTAVGEAIQNIYRGQLVSSVAFKTKFQPHLVWSLEQIKQNMSGQTHQHLDARPKGRFDGVDPEPREGIKSGHMPGSQSVPYTEMLDDSQMLLPVEELRKKFSKEGISLDRPIVVSCATGVTACIVTLGLHRIGKADVPVYDGSWTEWVTQPEATIITVATD